MDRSQKQAFIEELKSELNETSTLVVTHYQGLTVAEISKLRNNMREAGAKFRVTKNTLTKLAVDGTKFAELTNLFTGPVAIAYSQDPVAAAKAAVEFAKGNDNFSVIGGGLDAKVLSKAEVEALAKMPSLDELRAKILAVIQTPATRIAGVLQAPAGQLARVTKAYAEKA